MDLIFCSKATKQALPPHFLGCNASMGFALLNPSYGTRVVGWVEQSETHHCAQRSPIEPNPASL
ncbi:MAG TPA: hypothetical protein VHW66_20705 [Stellaceae bacterium]|jgi:hypothetical protein|nr:hypothetical protein [Stellaceae bacterium]